MKLIKISLFGDNDVGKTSVIKRYVNGSYSDEKPENNEIGFIYKKRMNNWKRTNSS